MLPGFKWEKLSDCTEIWGWYWVLYHQSVLPYVDDWYAVEHTPPCNVAKMAGLLEPGSRATQVCEARPDGKGPGHGEEHGYINRKNANRKQVTWEQVDAYPGGLGGELRELAKHFGYL